MPASRTGFWACWGARPDRAGQPVKMQDGEVDIDVRLVEQLVAGQFPHLADLTIDPVTSTATVYAIFRLGDRLCVRLPRVAAWSRDLHRAALAPRARAAAVPADSRAG